MFMLYFYYTHKQTNKQTHTKKNTHTHIYREEILELLLLEHYHYGCVFKLIDRHAVIQAQIFT